MCEGIRRRRYRYLLTIIVSKDIIVYTRSMSFSLKVGLYIYVGSAFIKGGLYSRVRRHFKKFKKIHRHIDYLTAEPSVSIVGFYAIPWCRDKDCEQFLTSALLRKFKSVVGFGATDKRGDSFHLFYCGLSTIYCINELNELLYEELISFRWFNS
ncbi:MAG: DUF123 domain-containing protein [Desulfurococcaceae archaeon]